jgi:hypothetical protein
MTDQVHDFLALLHDEHYQSSSSFTDHDSSQIEQQIRLLRCISCILMINIMIFIDIKNSIPFLFILFLIHDYLKNL